MTVAVAGEATVAVGLGRGGVVGIGLGVALRTIASRVDSATVRLGSTTVVRLGITVAVGARALSAWVGTGVAVAARTLMAWLGRVVADGVGVVSVVHPLSKTAIRTMGVRGRIQNPFHKHGFRDENVPSGVIVPAMAPHG